jgi:excisionase family DNA binding protein
MLLSVAEVAAELGCGRDTVYALLSSGLLPSVLVGARLRRIRRHDLQTYVTSLEPSIPAAAVRRGGELGSDPSLPPNRRTPSRGGL